MFEEYQPIPIRQFKGLWNRGLADTCPADHFIDCQNVAYTQDGVETRKGTEKVFNVGTINRIYPYKRINESSRFLVLNNIGQLFDSVVSLITPILTIVGMTDFSAVNFYNRVYISPHDGLKGLPNEKVYVYDGTLLRAAAGIEPSGTLIGANSAASGNVESGTHLFAVVFESITGFLSKPGPTLFASANAPGDKKIDLTGVPTGPAGTAKRHIIATPAIPTYTGNQFGQEYFFVPNGTINDNVTTTITINFWDSELIADALYLFDILDVIPAGLVLGAYKNRMVVGNFDGNQMLLRVSNDSEPESFDRVDGIIVVDPTEAGAITNIIEHRDLLGITKSIRCYATQDNGESPSTWDVQIVDKGIGTEVHGIGTILDSSGSHADKFLIADRAGIILFDGVFRKPELSSDIEDLWTRINKNYFHKVQLAYDSINEYIYAAVPLDAATSPSHIIFGDCSEGMDPEKIKWSKWKFPYNPTSIIVDVESNIPILKIAGDHLYKQTTALNDNLIAIDNWVKFALIPSKNDGQLNHFNAFTCRIRGNGSILPELTGEDLAAQIFPPPFVLSSAPGGEKLRLINFVGEKCSLKLEMSSIDENFQLNSLIFYYKAIWSQRPG